MPEPRPVVAPSLGMHIGFLLFRVLEWAAGIRAHGASARTARQPQRQPGAGAPRLWVFASTIGELNAIQPLLKALLAAAGDPPLLLVSDHAHYREAYLAQYPGAAFAHLSGGSAQALALVEAFPPRGLIVAEIPCLLSDAPCRFPFAVLYAVKRARAPVSLVNGWLYRQGTASRLDAIEKWLFDRAYVRLIDAFLVQTAEVGRELIDRGAPAGRVFVTGNIKFDAAAGVPWSPADARDPALLRAVAGSGRPCIVAGCVTNLDDQEAILDVFRTVLAEAPRALLILAPRHPEVGERMHRLESFLKERDLSYEFRTRLPRPELPAALQVLVLDTLGELKDFYAVATLAYVGANHNVLEPLAFGKPVFVKPGWERMYPSYPVYELLLSQGALVEAASDEDLAHGWRALLADPARHGALREHADAVLARQRGATRRCLDLLADARVIEGF